MPDRQGALGSRAGLSYRGNAARAKTEHLDQMAANAKAGAVLQPLDQLLHPTLVKAHKHTTAGTQHMMPMARTQTVAVTVVKAVDTL